MSNDEDTQTILKQETKEKNDEENNSKSNMSLILSKREQLKEIRNNLFTLQKKESQTLQDYSSLEVNQQLYFNNLRNYCKRAQIPNLKKNPKFIKINEEIDELFEKMTKQSDENKKLREKIVSNDHHNFIKINEEQNRASDARFKFDFDRVIYEKVKKENEILMLENQELKELSESIRDEFISLSTQQKLFEDEFSRCTIELSNLKSKFGAVTEKYIELKQKNQILNQEREKREKIYVKRLEEATNNRNKLQKYIDEILDQQKKVEAEIEADNQIVDDLNYNYERLDSEIKKLSQLSLRRKYQQDQFNLLIKS